MTFLEEAASEVPSPQGLRLRTQLENARRLTNRLAHDFSNLLTGVLGFSELGLAQLPEGSLARRYVQEVWESAQKGVAWVSKLRLFSQSSQGAFVPASLARVMAGEEARLRGNWGSRITFLPAWPENLPPVNTDEESLRQVLTQVLNNAGEAISGKGVVTLQGRHRELTEKDCAELLGAAQPGPHLEITVMDSGCGMGPEIQRRWLAELFFSTKSRGRGMGLALVLGILQTCGGGLRLGPGRKEGTVVRLYLPLAGR